MNKKLFYGILIVAIFILVVVGIGTFLLSEKSKPLSSLIDINGVIITTDKTEYIQAETVKIMIDNNLKNRKVILASFSLYFIEKFENGTWAKIRMDFCPCSACGAPIAVILEPNGREQFEWDQNEVWCSELGEDLPVSLGRYRVGSWIAYPDTNGEETSMIIYSKEFIIR